MTAPTRPVLRYHGGKWRLAPWIISHFPMHRTYVEPFGGAASVLLRKPRSYAEIYNDLDGEIVNLFRVVRDPVMGEQLAQAIELTPFARAEFVESYERSSDPLEQARRTVARSFQGFGSAGVTRQPSGFRANSNRSGTTPAHDWMNYPGCLRTIIQRLRGVVVENRPAIEVIRQHDGAQTLFYVDPPYVHSTRHKKGRRHAYQHEMTDFEHRLLAAVLRDVQGFVVLSAYDCELYRSLYPDWNVVRRASRADGAALRTETLWLSPNMPLSGFDFGERVA